MKKIIVSCLFLASIISCTDSQNDESQQENLGAVTNSKTIAKTYGTSYKNQLTYITSDEFGIGNFEAENDIQAKIDDPSITWSDFDGLYSASLSKAVKQDLGYIILSEKDLIGLVNANPTNSTYVNALKKYIDILVAEEYYGYTVLYYALDALKNIDSSYVKQKATQIAIYGNNDGFHKDIIDGGPTTTGWLDQNKLDIIKSNYDMLDNIKSF